MSSHSEVALHVIYHCSGHKVLSKGLKCELLCAQNNQVEELEGLPHVSREKNPVHSVVCIKAERL